MVCTWGSGVKGQLKKRNIKGLPQGQLKKDLTSRLLALLLSPSYTLLVSICFVFVSPFDSHSGLAHNIRNMQKFEDDPSSFFRFFQVRMP